MLSRRLGPLVLVVVTAIAALGAKARAETCPADPPSDPKVRRAEAKRWFDRAQRSGQDGNDRGALEAYDCSLKLVRHPFTAFNLGRVADKLGETEAALGAYRIYLQLAPDAEDREAIAERVRALEAKTAAPAPVNPEPEAPTPVARSSDPPQPRTEWTTPDPLPLAPAPVAPASPSPPPAPHPARTLGWVAVGSGGALLATGLVLNLLARSNMDDCRSLYARNDRDGAESACDTARPLAYGSYATLGVGAAAAAVGVGLLTFFGRQDAERVEGHAAFVPMPGGGLVVTSGRF